MSTRDVKGDDNRGRSSTGPAGGRTCLRRLVFLALLCAFPAAQAVLSGPEWEAKASRDPDLAAASAAIEAESWREAVTSLNRFIERRPWDDDALTLLGYAYRKLGEYRLSLEHYHRALELNPHHLGAMEYLGEAYVETGNLDGARALLDRIEITCRRIHGESKWRDACEEWRELAERIETGG